MSGRHTGEYLARELEALLKSFGIEKKVLTITCDNASNNDAMIKALNLEGFRGAESRIRCFPHILNLAVKATLSQFANRLEDEEAQPASALKSKGTRAKDHRPTTTTTPAPTRGTRKIAPANQGADGDSSDDDGDSSDDDSDSSDGADDEAGTGVNDIDPSDALDQDEDVIQAAEEAQEKDLDEAAQLAELEVAVTNHERHVASTALSKVSTSF